MTPRDVRERFAVGEGSWTTTVGAGDDTVVDWTAARDTSGQGSAKAGGASVAHARFEFHLGMLVAVRADLAGGAAAERISVTPRTVTVRRGEPSGGASLTVLARDCPTHKAEASAWVAKSGGR